MARLLELASRFVNLGIVGSITPAGFLIALALVLWTAAPKRETPSETLLYRFSPDYQLKQQLEELQDSRRLKDQHLQHALVQVAEDTRLTEQAKAELEHATELRNRVQAVFLDRWTGRHGLREEAHSALQKYQASVTDHRGAAARARKLLADAQAAEASHRASLDSLDERIAAVREQQTEQIPVAIGGLFQSVMLILLLGWMIGIVFNPVNKSLMSLGDRLWPTTLKKGQSSRPGPYRPDRHALFYVGKNVITQEEYDDLVNRYHRFAQILASLCIPVLALGGALSRWSTPCSWYRFSIPIACLVAVFLWILATRRYRRFHGRVECFISGRLRDIEEQRQREKKKELQVNLAGLAKLIARIEKVLEDYQACCCAQCKPKLASRFDPLAKAVAAAKGLLKGVRRCCCPKCKPKLDSCRAALENVVAEARKLLDYLKGYCCAARKCSPDSCHKALKQVVAGIENLLDHLESCCCPEPECSPNPCSADSAKRSP